MRVWVAYRFGFNGISLGVGSSSCQDLFCVLNGSTAVCLCLCPSLGCQIYVDSLAGDVSSLRASLLQRGWVPIQGAVCGRGSRATPKATGYCPAEWGSQTYAPFSFIEGSLT